MDSTRFTLADRQRILRIMTRPDQVEVFEPAGERRVVVLAAHGLNMRSYALRELYEPLREQGATIVMIRFRGHARADEADATMREEWKAIDAREWLDDWREGVQVARSLAAGLPLVYLGYSLGALVHLAGLVMEPETTLLFRRQILLAPPIQVRLMTRLVQLLRPLGRGFILRSLSPRDIRSHDGTSLAAYGALFTLRHLVSAEASGEPFKIPTLVLMDRQDELVSHCGLDKWVGSRGLRPFWQIRTIRKDSSARSRIHHYMIDERSLGRDSFAHLSSDLAKAVFEGIDQATGSNRA